MNRYEVSDYEIYVGRDRATGEFVAIVHEFPSLSWVSGASRPHAASGMRALLADVLVDMYENGEEPPAPRRHSGAEAHLNDLALV